MIFSKCKPTEYYHFQYRDIFLIPVYRTSLVHTHRQRNTEFMMSHAIIYSYGSDKKNNDDPRTAITSDATPAGNDYENVCAKVVRAISRGVDVYEFHPPFRRSVFSSHRIA